MTYATDPATFATERDLTVLWLEQQSPRLRGGLKQSVSAIGNVWCSPRALLIPAFVALCAELKAEGVWIDPGFQRDGVSYFHDAIAECEAHAGAVNPVEHINSYIDMWFENQWLDLVREARTDADYHRAN